MTPFKIQSLRSLKEEMLAVARGERPAPSDAGLPTFESIEALVHYLTRENRRLLQTIRTRKPQSVGELARMTGRAQPNVSRTLATLEAAGIVSMKPAGNRKIPIVQMKKIHVEIDLVANRDRMRAG